VSDFERSIPVPADVANACAMLGLDPLYVANEGKLVAFVPREQADEVLAAMRAHPLGGSAAIIGECVPEHPGIVVTTTTFGGTRALTCRSASNCRASADGLVDFELLSPTYQKTGLPGAGAPPVAKSRFVRAL
jgi:hydrogenase maturation factor